MAIWCAAYTFPRDFVKHGVCSWVTLGDIAAASKSADLAEAEATLREARLRLKPAGITEAIPLCNDLINALGRLDVFAARFLLRKQDRSAEVFGNLGAICRRYLDSLARAFPSADIQKAFAGLWEIWSGGGQVAPVVTCTILTTAAGPDVQGLHDRMPVILSPEDWGLWLSGAASKTQLQSLMQPLPAGRLQLQKVSTVVNRPAVDSPACLEPLSD